MYPVKLCSAYRKTVVILECKSSSKLSVDLDGATVPVRRPKELQNQISKDCQYTGCIKKNGVILNIVISHVKHAFKVLFWACLNAISIVFALRDHLCVSVNR